MILLATVVVITGAVVLVQVPYTTRTYVPSDEVFPNPGRGFYVQKDSADLDELNELSDQGITLVLLAYDLKDFVDQDISDEKLGELDQAFAQLERAGFKVIFRAAYGFDSSAEFGDPSSLERIFGHIDQIKPIWIKYRNTLLSVQAGFLGPWGEWHHSNLGDDEGIPTSQVANALIEALSDAVPEEVSIAVRRPRFMRWLDPQRIDLNRIAFHNDGLLASESDLGTYDDPDYSRDDELDFMAERSVPVANGGEMPWVSAFTEPSIAISTFEYLQVTYLNRNYNKDVLTDWASQSYQGSSFLTLIEQKLGYRWSIRDARLPRHFQNHQKITFSVTLMNTGFAAISFPASAEWVLSFPDGTQHIIAIPNVNLQELRPQSNLKLSSSLSLPSSPEYFTVGIRFKQGTSNPDERSALTLHLANQALDEHDGITVFARYTLKNNRYELEKSTQ